RCEHEPLTGQATVPGIGTDGYRARVCVAGTHSKYISKARRCSHRRTRLNISRRCNEQRLRQPVVAIDVIYSVKKQRQLFHRDGKIGERLSTNYARAGITSKTEAQIDDVWTFCCNGAVDPTEYSHEI